MNLLLTNNKILANGTSKLDIYWEIIENTFESEFCGMGNGYVRIPYAHSLYKQPYESIISDRLLLPITFGKLFQKDWVIGFDTCHVNNKYYSKLDNILIAMNKLIEFLEDEYTPVYEDRLQQIIN